MSDPTTSGGTPAAPAAAPTETAGMPPPGAFGTSRGTGLVRSKRPSQSAAPSASAAPAGFQPSSIEVIRPKSEYKNPFTGETSVDAPARPEPAVNEPAPQAAPVQPSAVAKPSADAVIAAPVARVAPAASTPPAAKPAPAPAASPMGEMFPFTPAAAPAAGAEKARLNILPPTEVKRPAQSWESPAAGPTPREPGFGGASASQRRERPDDRPVFRPERHDQRDSRRDDRDHRRPDDAPRPSDSRRDTAKLDASAPPVPVEAPSVGFFGWLKSLFGGKPKEKSSPSRSGESSRGGDGSSRDSHRHDGDGQRHRHRGGRDRHGDRPHGGDSSPRDSRDGESSGPDGHRSGEHRHDGGRRRRGGRGRRSREGGGGYPREEQGHRHSGGGSGLAPPPAS